MLEKYLSEKNISLGEIKNLFPDLKEILSSYEDIAGAEGFEDELNKIGREIVSMLKDRESQIDSFLETRPFAVEPAEVKEKITETVSEEPEIRSEIVGESMPDIEFSGEPSFLGSEAIDMEDIQPETTDEEKAEEVLAEIEEAPEDKIETEIASPEIKMIGMRFNGANFQQDMFLKILSVMGMDFSPKIKIGSAGDTNDYYWVLNDNNYFITSDMPFERKVNVTAVGEKMANIIQSKVSYESKEDISDAPDANDLEDIVSIEDKEPITGLTFKQVDESVLELFKVDSAAKLMTLLELGKRKFECGCGHI